jgi:hypothetical protein
MGGESDGVLPEFYQKVSMTAGCDRVKEVNFG